MRVVDCLWSLLLMLPANLSSLTGLLMLGIALWVISSPGMDTSLSWFLSCLFVTLGLLGG